MFGDLNRIKATFVFLIVFVLFSSGFKSLDTNFLLLEIAFVVRFIFSMYRNKKRENIKFRIQNTLVSILDLSFNLFDQFNLIV